MEGYRVTKTTTREHPRLFFTQSSRRIHQRSSAGMLHTAVSRNRLGWCAELPTTGGARAGAGELLLAAAREGGEGGRVRLLSV